MADIQAYAINTIKLDRSTTIQASTKDEINIFTTDKDTYKRPEGLGAVRKPTEEELTLFEAKQARLNGDDIPKSTAKTADNPDGGADTVAPKSGAKGDPNGKPTGATTKNTDLGV